MLGRKLLSNTVFAVVDQLISKIGTTLAFIVLVRLLPQSDIASVGVATSYLVLIAYLDVGLIRILLRDYTKIHTLESGRDSHFSAYLVFWLIQMGVICSVAAALQFFVLQRLHVPGLSLLYWALTIDFMALVLQDWIKTIFFADLQQSLVTVLSFVLTVARLCALALLLLWPTLDTYIWILIGAAAVSAVYWISIFLAKFRFRFQMQKRVWRIIGDGLSSYGIWDHFNRMVIDTLFSIDVAILSLVGQTANIASYSIALRLTSLLMLVPRQLSASMQVALSKYADVPMRMKVINSYLKVNLLLSVAQWLFVLIAGRWLVVLLFGNNIDIEQVLHFVNLISLAVLVFGLGCPLIGIINNMGNLRRAFTQVFLPTFLIGIAGYFYAGSTWGAGGIAYAHVGAYVLMVMLLGTFAVRNSRFRIQWQLVTPDEADFLRRLVKR